VRVMLVCNDAVTGAPVALTRTIGLASPRAMPDSGTTCCWPAGMTIAAPPGGTSGPGAPNTVSSTVAATRPGLEITTPAAAPVSPDPPTSQDSMRGGRQAEAA